MLIKLRASAFLWYPDKKIGPGFMIRGQHIGSLDFRGKTPDFGVWAYARSHPKIRHSSRKILERQHISAR